jgi:tryptophan synthase alpha chain
LWFGDRLPLSFKNRPALIAYLTCGDPDLGTTFRVAMAALEAGADILELGVPFSDPVADGPVIQRATERALRTTVADVLQLARQIRKQAPDAGLIAFSYLNPILRFGLERFADEARQARLDGALITDLTVEEAAGYIGIMRQRGLATVFLAAPTSTDARLKRIAAASSGFVYVLHQAAHRRRVRHLYRRTSGAGSRVCRWRGSGQRHCARHRTGVGCGSTRACGRIDSGTQSSAQRGRPVTPAPEPHSASDGTTA